MTRWKKEKVYSPNDKEVITHLYEIFSTSLSAGGFKLKFPVQFEAFPELIDELNWIGKRLRVIILERRNVLKQAVSKQNMLRIQSHTGECNLRPASQGDAVSPVTNTQLTLDIPEAVRYAETALRQQRELELEANHYARITDGNIHRVWYEELFSDQNQVLSEVHSFLGVEPDSAPSSVFEKATKNTLRDAISNYEALAETVRGSELSKHLDD